LKASSKIFSFWASAVMLTCLLTGCATEETVQTKTTGVTPHRVVGQEIAGQWQVVDSSARFKISFKDGEIRIKGWDSEDGEQFIISYVEWDGKRLKGNFSMPSTGHTTFSDLELIDTNTLKGTYKGGTSSGEEVWKRE
jgi:hypothetical protein